jgi:hypothetical protein
VLTPTPTPTPVTPTDGEDADEDALDGDEEGHQLQEPAQSGTKERPGATNLQDPPMEQRPERLEILDLHTENPIVTYKAHTFSCSWAENIGTELLFTSHDPAKPLPVLRSLPENVDLLAASSARLISKCVKLVPKHQPRLEPDMDYAEDSNRNPGLRSPKPGGITIPIGRGASDSRRDQGRFLERMMEIKRRKGEGDAVTVTAQRRLYPAGWRTLVKEKRAEERAGLRLLIRKGGEDAKNAAKRLEQMDKEERAIAQEVKQKKENVRIRKSKPGRKPKEVDGQGGAKGAKGISFGRRPRGGRSKFKLFQDAAADNTATPGERHHEDGIVSTPTPQRWNELDGSESALDDEDMADS